MHSAQRLRRQRGLPRARSRGSLLLVALVFAAVAAVMLTGYLKLSVAALKLSQRAAYSNQAMNLTETGLEQAMVAINGNSWSSPWTTSGANATAVFSGFPLQNGATGSVRVCVQNYSSSNPLLVAKGIVTPASGAPIVKMVECSGLLNRSLFAKGMVGRNGVTLSGSASVDSWNSNPTNAAPGAYVPVDYSLGTRQDHGSIATTTLTSSDSVGTAFIWGTASVGGSSTSAITLAGGSIGPFGTPSGTKDPSSVFANFTEDLPAATAPTPPSAPYGIATITSNPPVTLPRIGDSPASDGTYYYLIGSVSVSNSTGPLTIAPGRNVVLIVSAGEGSNAVTTSGSGYIALGTGSTMAIYTAGNVTVSGGGIVNGNLQPVAAQIYGTGVTPGRQSITISGSGQQRAVVYAPNADVTLSGSGGAFGAVVGYTATLSGGAAFHYDEMLGNLGGAGGFRPTKWRELISAGDRALYAAQLP